MLIAQNHHRMVTKTIVKRRAKMCKTKMNSCLASVLVAAVLLAQPAGAADDGKSKLQVHGFMTQAWADANYTDGGPTSDEVVLGIPEDGTTDYRTLALQFRYQISPKDLLIIQLSHRALGNSPIELAEDEIELDWGFYERRITDNTSIKVGRIQIPLGIFNEIRDVGTVLPFFRPPFTFYREGSFTSETVDGLMFGHTFFSGSDWSLDLDAYAGEWELIEADVFDPSAAPKTAQAKDAWGVQLWLNTSINGLRLGAGFQRRDVSGGQEGIFRPVGKSNRFDDYFFSLEGQFERWVVRAEHRQFGGDAEIFFVGPTRAFQTISYAQVGFHFTESFHIFLQAEQSVVDQEAPSLTEGFSIDFRTDYGIALNYRISPNTLVKAEYHENEAELAMTVPTPDGQLMPLIANFANGSYSIVSLAVSF